MARITSDNVNLRARPDLRSETVGQLNADDEVKVRSRQEGWVEIVPPDSVDFWVHRDFIVDDTVVVSKLNARSGASVNYNVVGSFSKNDTVQRRGSFGEWIKVAAPSDASLWISSDYVESILPPAPVPTPSAAPPHAELPMPEEDDPEEIGLIPVVEPLETPVDEPVIEPGLVEPSPAPADLDLIPLDGQGMVIHRAGLLKRSPMLVFNAPGSHRLVRRDGNRIVTTAYLRGNAWQLDELLDHELVIHGREYWVEDIKVPVVVIESIEKRSFY